MVRHGKRLKHYVSVKCKCGREKAIRLDTLKSGQSKMCGHCAAFKRSLKHGYCNTPEYFCWDNMKQRCLNPASPTYKYYGGRGIQICKRWLNSFENFIADIGKRPTPQHSIDRINNDGNYEPGNCRWTTKTIQQNNRRKSNKKTE